MCVVNVISDLTPVLSGVSQWLFIGPDLRLLKINNLPDNLQIFCLMFVDDTKCRGRSSNVGSTRIAILASAGWAGINEIFLHAVKSPHELEFQLNFSFLSTLMINQVKNLVILLDSTPKPAAQVNAAFRKHLHFGVLEKHSHQTNT